MSREELRRDVALTIAIALRGESFKQVESHDNYVFGYSIFEFTQGKFSHLEHRELKISTTDKTMNIEIS